MTAFRVAVCRPLLIVTLSSSLLVAACVSASGTTIPLPTPTPSFTPAATAQPTASLGGVGQPTSTTSANPSSGQPTLDACRYLIAGDLEPLSVHAPIDSTAGASNSTDKQSLCGYVFRNQRNPGPASVREVRGVLTLSTEELGAGRTGVKALPELGEGAEIQVLSFKKNGIGNAGIIVRFRTGPYWGLFDFAVTGSSGDFSERGVTDDAIAIIRTIQERVARGF
jgi:hypothetical protein